MDAFVHVVSADSIDSVTLFTGNSGKGLHRVYFYNTDDTLPATLYLRVQEGTTDNQMTLSKLTLAPGEDKKWIGTIGADDSFTIEAHNPYSSSIVETEFVDGITTEDGRLIGSYNNMTVNYSWW